MLDINTQNCGLISIVPERATHVHHVHPGDVLVAPISCFTRQYRYDNSAIHVI